MPIRSIDPPANPCGPVGAFFAHVLFISLGWSSWLLLLGLAVINILLIGRRSVPDRLGPAVGFVLILIVSAGFIHRLAPGSTPSPTVGSGGYIGAAVAIFLEALFPPDRHDPHPRRDRSVRPGALP